MFKKIGQGLFQKKLIAIFSFLIVLATVTIGMTGYLTAKKALDLKGKQILTNSVDQAAAIVKLEYDQVMEHQEPIEKAQEEVKEVLLGVRNPDGTRGRENQINLGKNGYFIIYDSKGNEVMHPTLEGKNVWEVTDVKDSHRKIVQEQIQKAKNGGGFMDYFWQLPESVKVGEKMSYGIYFKEWDWVIVATAYKMDFNSDANQMIKTTVIATVILLLMIIYLIQFYIYSITQPVSLVLKGMKRLEDGAYQEIEAKRAKDEMKLLVSGYNHMIHTLDEADEAIRNKNIQITHLAFHDDMTDLPNFYGLENHIDQNIGAEFSSAALILIKVKGLNVINAIMGYDQGNNLLKEIGKFLLERTGIFYSARISGNEFAIWMKVENRDTVQECLQGLKKQMLQHTADLGYGQTVYFRFSYSCYPEHGTRFEDLYEKVTLAMKLTEDVQGMLIGEYQPFMHDEMNAKVKIVMALAEAFDRDEIIPYYQAKVDYTDGSVKGVEALARWESDFLGIISPAVFIPLILEKNMGVPFTEHMIRRTLREYHALCRKYNTDCLEVSINIIPSLFLDSNLPLLIEQVLTEYQIPEGSLVLEITEDVLISDLEEVQVITERLHALGVRISIDDFGTGYSSLNYLTRIDFDELKIDKTFIDRITTDPKVFDLVNIFCDIGRVCGYTLVAEGVENEEQLNQLKKTELKYIQGYLYSRPEPL